jgi:hypothetical protein
MRDGLVARGFDGDQLFAIDLGDTNRSTLEQMLDLATFVDDVLAATGASRVDAARRRSRGRRPARAVSSPPPTARRRSRRAARVPRPR